MISPEDVIDEYTASLIEPDEIRRARILELVWADDCEVVLPEMRLTGRDAINRHITAVRRDFGGGTPMIVGPIDAHNGFVRFEWQVVDSTGAIVSAGMNVGEQGPDGRFRRVILFRGVRPGQLV
jgi:hypothetical protein